MNNTFKTYGILYYSPKALGKVDVQNYWLVVKLEDNNDLGKYIRQLFYLSTFKCYKLLRPAWKEHITVVRNLINGKTNEIPTNLNAWEKYKDNKIEFEIENKIENNGDYYWLPIKCEKLLDIREELGLERNPYYPLHLSIGHHIE